MTKPTIDLSAHCSGIRVGALAQHGDRILLYRPRYNAQGVEDSLGFFELFQEHVFALDDLADARLRLINVLRILRVKSLDRIRELGSFTDTCTGGTSQHVWHLLQAEPDGVVLTPRERLAAFNMAQRFNHFWPEPKVLHKMADRTRAFLADGRVTTLPTLAPLTLQVLERSGLLAA